nr:hypothetical protein [Tanacetum cinerariifolium]
MRKEKISSKEVVFTKSDVSTSNTSLEITSDSESEVNTQIPLPFLPKLLRAEPSGTTKCLTITKTKKTIDKVVPISVKHASSTEKLLLTLMQEVKGLKEQIQTHSETSSLPLNQGVL